MFFALFFGFSSRFFGCWPFRPRAPPAKGSLFLFRNAFGPAASQANGAPRRGCFADRIFCGLFVRGFAS